jgi:hypothetical protein
LLDQIRPGHADRCSDGLHREGRSQPIIATPFSRRGRWHEASEDQNSACERLCIPPGGLVLRVGCQTASKTFHPTAPKTFQFNRSFSVVFSSA